MKKFVARGFIISTLFFSLFLIFSQNSIMAQERELVSMMLTTSQGSFLYESRSVTLNLDGQILPEADMPPIVLENRTFVPVRHMMEAMGAIVDFHDDEEQQRIMIAYQESLIVMHIGQQYFYLDESRLQMDVAPQIINDRTLVPVSFIANALGFDVYWENETATVYITSPMPPVLEYNGHDETNDEQPPVMPNEEEVNNTDADYYNGDVAGVITPAMPDANHTAETNFITLSRDASPGRIANEANAQTSVHHVSWNGARTQFAITAAGRITWADWQMLEDGRLIIDIHNATADFGQASHTINNGFISTIRTGQNVFDGGINVARIVFDLTAPVVYSITISEDRTNVFIAFEQNSITQIDFLDTFEATGRESIVITGRSAPVVDTFVLFDPPRLVIDVANAELGFDSETFEISDLDGQFVQGIRYSQFDETTVRVVADLTHYPAFDVQTVGNTATIHITPPTFRNINYNSATGTIEIEKPETGINISQILEFERYLERRYLFVLPGDFSDHLGYGEFVIRHNSLRSVEISTENGMTQIMFETTQIMAYDITEDDTHIFIRPIHPRERYDFIVVIDPGHGGSQPGALHHGMREADINLDTALIVLEMLEADGRVRAYMTRYTDVTVANSLRAQMANQTADIFVSIHYNAANGRAHGTETLYFVTEHENAAGFNSRSLARIMQDQLLAELGSFDRGLRNRPGIVVLNSTRIPAVLVEVGFMDNPAEAALIAQPAYRRRAAEAIVRGIYEAMEAYSPRN